MTQRLRVVRSPRRLLRRAAVHHWRSRPYVSQADPIVIGGCGRSGTTLLRVMLDSHPSICCGPESRLLLPEFLDDARLDSLASRFELEPSQARAARRHSSSQAEFVDRFFRLYCETRKKPRWAEKTPKNVQALDFVFRHFPNARFVHVIRDGRDTVCSLRTHPRHAVVDGELVELDTWNPLERCIERWLRDVREGLAYRNDPRAVEIRYEDLVERPEPTLRRLLDHLGEPWDDRVLEFSEVGGNSRDVTKFPQNPEATTPLYRSAVSRWRTDLTPEEGELFKRLAGDLLVELGYASDDRWRPDAASPAVPVLRGAERTRA